MLSFVELERAATILNSGLRGAQLHQVAQLDDFTSILTFQPRDRRASRDEIRPLLVTCRPDFARVSECSSTPAETLQTLSFAQFTRAHLRGAMFLESRIRGEDRQLSIKLTQKGRVFEVVLSVLGARSNIYILDAEGRLCQAMRALEKTRRDLSMGGKWSDPVTPLRSRGSDRWAAAADAEFLKRVEETYRRIESAKQVEDYARKVSTAIKRELRLIERRRINTLLDRESSDHLEEYRIKGELLKGVLHRVHMGDEEVRTVDYESDKEVAIELDRTLTPAGNMRRYFNRYQKERRREKETRRRLGILDQELRSLEELRGDFESLLSAEPPDPEGIRSFALPARIRRAVASVPGRTSARREAGKIPGRLLPRRFQTETGLEIWVGRSDAGNDYLTTRMARGNDLFFHLEDSPGSHVVLRTEGRQDPPSGALVDACELAVHFSRMSGVDRADIRVASIKHVKKPSGAKPGLVFVLRGKTVHLRREPQRLQRLLASRLDEPER